MNKQSGRDTALRVILRTLSHSVSLAASSAASAATSAPARALALASFVGAGSTAALGAVDPSLEKLRQIPSSWDVDLTVALEGGRRNVDIGDELRYHLNAGQDGVCYLIHVDATGASSLMRPSDCRSIARSGSYFPSSGTLTAAEPMGRETVFAVLLPKESEAADMLLRESVGYVPVDGSQLTQLVSELASASASGQLAIAEASYLVGDEIALSESGLQYTSRGIIAKVMESTGEEEELEQVMNEISFDVQSIQFEFESAELTPDGTRQLNEFGTAMQSPELGNLRLRVEGHTDDLGAADYNLDLSQRRAAAVAQYLADNFGISSERLEVMGVGENSPLIEDTTLEARAVNRRVEMVFLKL
jgi:outer membrane protein OmpA-like peptidoglycan-associated protein